MECKSCKGTGLICASPHRHLTDECPNDNDCDSCTTTKHCPECNGTGQDPDLKCKKCNGVWNRKTYTHFMGEPSCQNCGEILTNHCENNCVGHGTNCCPTSYCIYILGADWMEQWKIKEGWTIEIPQDYKDYLNLSVGDEISFEIFDNQQGKRGLLVVKKERLSWVLQFLPTVNIWVSSEGFYEATAKMLMR